MTRVNPVNLPAVLTGVLVAPDTFKGTLPATQAAEAIAQGVRKVYPNCRLDLCPLADGGEGSLLAVHPSLGGQLRRAEVLDPLGRGCPASWLQVPEQNLGVIELAEASGLLRVSDAERCPLQGTTYGTGQLLQEAIDHDCKNIILFLGGSATIDGGLGMAHAMGVKLLNAAGEQMNGPLPPKQYHSIARIDSSAVSLQWDALTIACDVNNPLIGSNGAAQIYGPQKGASSKQVRVLENALLHLSSFFPNVDPLSAGTGAAGGAGFGAKAMLGGTIVSGIETIMKLVNFQERCRNVSLVITGEGQLDSQSNAGKVCSGVASTAAANTTPTIAVVGRTAAGFESMLTENGGPLATVIELSEYTSPKMAMQQTADAIEISIEKWLRDQH